ncbi:hypothetical protein O9992_19510 [Vibrio lentus]|nr:hypothetical protein [Vibrio lentus]
MLFLVNNVSSTRRSQLRKALNGPNPHQHVMAHRLSLDETTESIYVLKMERVTRAEHMVIGLNNKDFIGTLWQCANACTLMFIVLVS